MIARQKDTGFGWKLEDFEFCAAYTIFQHLHFFFLNLKNRKKIKTYFMPMHMSVLKLNSTILYIFLICFVFLLYFSDFFFKKMKMLNYGKCGAKLKIL
jgi:hypothetical protein